MITKNYLPWINDGLLCAVFFSSQFLTPLINFKSPIPLIFCYLNRKLCLIVNTGIGLKPIIDDIATLLGCKVIAVCTHSHHDHACGLCEFKNRYGLPAEAEIFAKPNCRAIVAELLDAYVVQRVPYEGFDADRWCYATAPLTKEIGEGDAIYDGTLYDHLYHSVPEQLCKSLQRLKEFPIQTVQAGHFNSFSGNRMKTIIYQYLNGQSSMLCPSKIG